MLKKQIFSLRAMDLLPIYHFFSFYPLHSRCSMLLCPELLLMGSTGPAFSEYFASTAHCALMTVHNMTTAEMRVEKTLLKKHAV